MNKKQKSKKSPTRVEALPRITSPELATLIDAPFDDAKWLFEIKWDGFRAIATIDADGELTIASRNGKDLLSRFPALFSLKNAFKDAPIIVDGEIVALDESGKSSFQGLQNGARADLTFVAFDLLYAEGRDLQKEPLEARKEILERVLKKDAKNVALSTHVLEKGKALFKAASEQGLEGIIAKRRDSEYAQRRTRDWLKIKAQLEQECVICGYTEPGGARSGFGSLVLGVYEKGKSKVKGGELVYCGNVGTGFDGKMLALLEKKLHAIETTTCPFAEKPKTRTRAHWVAPKLVAQIRFTEWTRDGSMRHPAFLGLRDDKSPSECHRETPVPKR